MIFQFTTKIVQHSALSWDIRLLLTSRALMQLKLCCLRICTKKEICRQGCIEKMQPLSAREKHTQPVISIADASDRKWEKASCIQPESEHCPRTTQQFYCMLQCGSGVRIQWLEFTVDMCGIQGFPLITAKCQSEDVVARKQNKA